MAYPGGAFNANVKTWVSASRLTGRKVGESSVNYPNVDKFELFPANVDNISDENLAALKIEMDNTLLYHSANILYMHGVSVEGGVFEIATSKLIEIIDYAQLIGLDIITISELYELLD